MRELDAVKSSLRPGRHVTAAAVAAVLSLALHIAGFFYVSEMDLGIPLVFREMLSRPEPETGPFQVAEIREEPPPEALRPEALKPSDEALNVNVVRQAEALQPPPNRAAVAPRPVADVKLAGEAGSLAGPAEVPLRNRWQARQEVLTVEREVVSDAVSALSRRRVPRVERVEQAPDVVVAVDREAALARAGKEGGAQGGEGGRGLAQAEIGRTATGFGAATNGGVQIGESTAQGGEKLFQEAPAQITPLKAIERLLTARLTLYSTWRELRHAYFKIEIERAGPELLPVVPKDVLLVQDCSASMTEQRLYFCRLGLSNCLSRIGAQDRFNVVRFRTTTESCFPSWSLLTPASRDKALGFIAEISAAGNTDIFSSMKELLRFERVPGRPVIALVVSDGYSTAGITDSSDIIGQFSRQNEGAISVFTLGTVQTANSYLLDLLSYCNRGETHIETRGRWDIPMAMTNLTGELSRPVLSDVRLLFAEDSACEVYPDLVSNLYLDRPLAIYGRCPKSAKRLVFQAVGRAQQTQCDMIFDLDLTRDSESGERDIRSGWATQKIYSLIGRYARRPDTALLREIRETSSDYGVRVPYRGVVLD